MTAAAATATVDLVEPGVVPDPKRNAEALDIVNKWSVWAMAPGILPFPFLDLVAIAGIQMKMLQELSEKYGLKFSQNRFKNITASFLGSFGAAIAGTGVAFSLIKAVPIVGKAAGVLALPAVAGASTYAIGRLFQMHFASGGTFLSFNPDRMRTHFEALYQENLHENLKRGADKKDASK